MNTRSYTEHQSKMSKVFEIINECGKIEDNIEWEIDEEDSGEDDGNTFYWKFYGEERDMGVYVDWIKDRMYSIECILYNKRY